MPCVENFNWQRFDGDIWRIIEGQYFTSTRKLVESQEDQDLLELLIDSAKPLHPSDINPDTFHYLLHTPFRYPPLRYGSRFGSVQERGIWYGAAKATTCMAEVSYYKFLFFDGSEFDFKPMQSTYSAFTAAVKSVRAYDCQRSLPSQELDQVCSPISYSASIPLGQSLREAGGEVVLYPSSRDPKRGQCLAIYHPSVFAQAKRLKQQQEWTVYTDATHVEWRRRTPTGEARHGYVREQFLIDGKLPSSGV